MNEKESAYSEYRSGGSSARHVSHRQDASFGPNEFCVRTGIDVTAIGPGPAILSAIEGMRLRDPEGYCFHVEHLRTGRKWYVDLLPSGEIDVQDWDE